MHGSSTLSGPAGPRRIRSAATSFTQVRCRHALGMRLVRRWPADGPHVRPLRSRISRARLRRRWVAVQTRLLRALTCGPPAGLGSERVRIRRPRGGCGHVRAGGHRVGTASQSASEMRCPQRLTCPHSTRLPSRTRRSVRRRTGRVSARRHMSAPQVTRGECPLPPSPEKSCATDCLTQVENRRTRPADSCQRSPDTPQRSMDRASRSPDSSSASPDTARPSSGSCQPSPDTRRGSMNTASKSCDTGRRSLDTPRGSSESCQPSPDTGRRSPDTRRRSPGTGCTSIDTGRTSMDTGWGWTDTGRGLIDNGLRTPDDGRESRAGDQITIAAVRVTGLTLPWISSHLAMAPGEHRMVPAALGSRP